MGTLAGATINAALRDQTIASFVSQGFTKQQATYFYDAMSKLSDSAVTALKLQGVLDKEGNLIDTPRNRGVYEYYVAQEQETKDNILKMYNEQGYSVTANPQTGAMYKVPISDLDMSEEIEFHSPSSRLPVLHRPFLINMIDSQFKRHAIIVNKGKSTETMITGIKLSPSPESLTINSAKIINRYHTMTRWVEEHWGDEIDTVTFSGGTFSFFGYQNSTIDKTKIPVNVPTVDESSESSQITATKNKNTVRGYDIIVPASPDTGLTLKYRQETGPYQMLKALSNFFNYNGVIYQDNETYDGVGRAQDAFLEDTGNVYFLTRHPRTGMIKERLYIKVTFDYVSLIGYFETFDIIEEATKPYKMTYNAVFKAEQTEYQMQAV